MEATVFNDEFVEAAVRAGLQARQKALAAGHAVIFKDELGRFVQEFPDGRRFEVRLIPGVPRESSVEILAELSQSAA